MDDELSVEKEKKGWWNNTALIVIVAVVAVLILVTITFGSFIYLWVTVINEPYYYEEYRTLNLMGEIDATDDQLELMVISGAVHWDEYVIKAENSDYSSLYLETSDHSTNAGEIAMFTNYDWDPIPEGMYNIKIIDVANNMVLWDKDIIARAS